MPEGGKNIWFIILLLACPILLWLFSTNQLVLIIAMLLHKIVDAWTCNVFRLWDVVSAGMIGSIYLWCRFRSTTWRLRRWQTMSCLCRLWDELVASNYVLSWTIDICLQLQASKIALQQIGQNQKAWLFFFALWMTSKQAIRWCWRLKDLDRSVVDIHLHACDVILSKPSSIICLCLMQVKAGEYMLFRSFICMAIIGLILDLRYVSTMR